NEDAFPSRRRAKKCLSLEASRVSPEFLSLCCGQCFQVLSPQKFVSAGSLRSPIRHIRATCRAGALAEAGHFLFRINDFRFLAYSNRSLDRMNRINQMD